MTLDAMHWVWNHSQSKGNARIALLYVADQVRTPACEVRLSYAEFMAAMNTGRPTVREAIRAALETGELNVLEQGKGRRASLYSLPKAVGYVRPSMTSGSDSEPLQDRTDSRSGSESEPLEPRSGSDSEPLGGDRDGSSGSDSEPLDARSGSDSDPHSPTTPSKQAEGAAGQPDDSSYGIPDVVRPLVDSMTASGVVVRWPFTGNQWFPLVALITKCGVPALVAYARRTADRTHVDSARYFMRGWSELPPKPAAGSPVHTPRPHLRAVGQSPEDRGIF